SPAWKSCFLLSRAYEVVHRGHFASSDRNFGAAPLHQKLKYPLCRFRRAYIVTALTHRLPEENEERSKIRNMAQAHSETAGYGLRREVLSPMETLAQSVSTIAPTTTPVATIPLVCALAGNGTWLAYVLATAAILLVALCIGKFARYSSSPGSLYTYASMILPPSLGATAAWSLLLAYIATGSSVI